MAEAKAVFLSLSTLCENRVLFPRGLRRNSPSPKASCFNSPSPSFHIGEPATEISSSAARTDEKDVPVGVWGSDCASSVPFELVLKGSSMDDLLLRLSDSVASPEVRLPFR